ncbi:hypothetical protein AB4212_25050, partial [Streptomyces sp. 2MCAF27]
MADIPAAAERERVMARVAHADALVWSLPFGSRERLDASFALADAQHDADNGPAAEAAAEAHEWSESARAASADEWEDADGETRTGALAAWEAAEYAHKETMIEYGAFERSNGWGGVALPSAFAAETACDIVCGHSRDMAKAVRDAEAAADAAEAAARQAEVWADAAAEAEGDSSDASGELFAMGAPDARQLGLSLSLYGVTERAAAEWAAEAAEAPAPVLVPQGVTVGEAQKAPEAPETPATVTLPGVGVVPVGFAANAVDGVSVPVVTNRGDDVQVWFAGYVEMCWGHCAPECGGWEGACEGCATLRPVMLCDGEGQPYSWQDCADCMADRLGVSAGVIARAFTAVAGKVAHAPAALAMARHEFERADSAANVAEGRAERAGWGEAPREWEADRDRTEYGHVRDAVELADWAAGLRGEADERAEESASWLVAARMAQASCAEGVSVPVATVDGRQGEEAAQLQELDANASNMGSAPGGEGGFSRELDADASKEVPGEAPEAAADAGPAEGAPVVVERPAVLPDVVSDPGGVDGWET